MLAIIKRIEGFKPITILGCLAALILGISGQVLLTTNHLIPSNSTVHPGYCINSYNPAQATWSQACLSII